MLHKEEELVILAIYVDDILLACSEENTLSDVVLSLNKYVDAIDRGPVNYYLGMEIKIVYRRIDSRMEYGTM